MRIRDLLTPGANLNVTVPSKGISKSYNGNDDTSPEKIKAEVALIISRKPQEPSIDELPLMYGDQGGRA